MWIYLKFQVTTLLYKIWSLKDLRRAIACNLPVVNLPKEFMRCLHSYVILKILETTETIDNSESEYIDIAVKLRLGPTWRARIGSKMRTRIDYLFNDQVCIQALEEFFQNCDK
jgi:protein O-GlcNAc transferase